MSIRTNLLNNFPSNIDKTSEIFTALVSNSKGTGVIESALNDLITFMGEWYSTPSLYEQKGEQFDRTLSFFSYLTRFTDETDKSIKNRVAALFIRNHDTSWGSRFNIQKIFEQYFPSGKIYVVENSYPIEDSIIKEGDFVSHDVTKWNIVNAEIAERARFSKSFGVALPDGSSEISQTIDVDNAKDSAFFLHFFCQGKCSAEIKDNNGRYWNSAKHYWQENKSDTIFESSDWENFSVWFTNFSEGLSRAVDNSITSVTITIKGSDSGECFIDYVRVFEKQPYPSFTLIAHFTNSNSFGSLALFPGNEDPVDGETETSYDNAGYFNQVYMSGVSAGFAQDLYQDLLDYVRASGVKANIEIVSKDMDKDN